MTIYIIILANKLSLFFFIQKRIVRSKFCIYVFITIAVSIPLAVD